MRQSHEYLTEADTAALTAALLRMGFADEQVRALIKLAAKTPVIDGAQPARSRS